MAPPRKTRIPPSLDIPVLTEVVDESAPEQAPQAQPGFSQELLAEMITERIAMLADRLLRDASAEIHATLVNKVWEKLRDEIPAIVEEALKDNGKE